jgi:TolB-like protein
VAAALGFYLFSPRERGLPKERSIAVLPLKPINSTNRDELYEIGVADALIHRLSSMKGFVVRPLNTVRKYGEISQDPLAAGREQQVDYVLDSNYQLSAGQIRITAKLINVATGEVIETYKSEKGADDIFALQDAIANEVGNILRDHFTTTHAAPPLTLEQTIRKHTCSICKECTWLTPGLRKTHGKQSKLWNKRSGLIRITRVPGLARRMLTAQSGT